MKFKVGDIVSTKTSKEVIKVIGTRTQGDIYITEGISPDEIKGKAIEIPIAKLDEIGEIYNPVPETKPLLNRIFAKKNIPYLVSGGVLLYFLVKPLLKGKPEYEDNEPEYEEEIYDED